MKNQFFSGSYLYASNAKESMLWNNGVNTHVWSKAGKDQNEILYVQRVWKKGSRDFTFNKIGFVRTKVKVR